MHAYDHGVAMTILTAIIKSLHLFEALIGLAKNTLIHKLTARFQNLCNTLTVKHATLMSFVNQSIVECLETFTTPKKNGQKQTPIVDASDVQRLMLALPYMLDGLVSEELEAFNQGKPQAQRVADPMPPMIMAVNEWLHWYHQYRAEESDDGTLPNLDRKGRDLLVTLETVFPHKIRLSQTITRSMFCTEKVHSVTHGSHTIKHMGRSRNVSCQVTECKLKDVKAKGHMTNRDPATYGFSIMQAEARESSARMMAQDADELGTHSHIQTYTCMYKHIQVAYKRIQSIYVYIHTYTSMPKTLDHSFPAPFIAFFKIDFGIGHRACVDISKEREERRSRHHACHAWLGTNRGKQNSWGYGRRASM